MQTQTDKKVQVWKVRTIKNYPQAHNHILVGKVLEMTDSYIKLHCRTYHFGPALNKPDDVLIGGVMERIIPWARVEIVNELPSSFDYVRSSLVADKEGEVLFKDSQHKYPFAPISDSIWDR